MNFFTAVLVADFSWRLAMGPATGLYLGSRFSWAAEGALFGQQLCLDSQKGFIVVNCFAPFFNFFTAVLVAELLA